MISVVCPIYNEEKYIDGCIASILAQDYPKSDLEVIFVDGMSSDRTREIIDSYISSYPFIRVIDNPKRIVPVAMNIGIKYARGEVIIRLDAHAAYATNYFSALTDSLMRYDADNVGAPCRTDVLNKTPKALAIREVLCNRFGVGNSTFRLGIDRAMEVDTVPFGCWRKDVFDKYGYFDERLVRNQDIELNKRIKRGGGKILLVPDTYSTYYARETYGKIAKNNYSNGRWNILTVYYTKQLKSLGIRHFIPLTFVLSILLPIVAAPLYLPAIWVAALSMTLYLSAISIVSAKIARKKRSWLHLMAAFFTLHFSYGLGSLTGILELSFKNSNKLCHDNNRKIV